MRMILISITEILVCPHYGLFAGDMNLGKEPCQE
jgi:hypothetical protein